ncbi:MAG: hypothetical protein MUE30_04150 [Spirosomaceae bacterium]|nr:hypothetical protein [Spirosomataceae bacterium]
MRSGKMVHCFEFILLFYCYLQRETLQKHIPYFFWFCYGLACYSLLELLFVDVLLSSKFQFVNVLFPWLNTHFGVVDFNFTAFINYLIKFVFIALFLRDSFKSPTLKQTFQYLMWALVVFEVVQVVVFKSYQGYDSLSSTVKNFFILGGAGLLLYYIYRAPEVTLPLQKNTYFWICLGLFLPALTEFFLEFIFSKLYQTDAVSFYKYYLLRNASQMVGFTLLIVGVWQAKYLKYLLKEF